ncbi:MAG: cupin domain-containing protein [Methanosphaera sp.]|nr:cupin domain-containing protein [Methanosphaera sp.]
MSDEVLFGKCESNPFGEFFVGDSYLKWLTTEGIAIGNVTFEPGCRNNWHIHHADEDGGQILLATNGEGGYQEEGKPAQKLTPGSVVIVPANVKHWHGVAKDSEFTHLAIDIPGTNTSTEWLEPVSDEEYSKLD